jgi:hypothetical protein
MYRVIIITLQGDINTEEFNTLADACEFLERAIDLLDYEFQFVGLTGQQILH